jgi:hypothetical protein
MHIYAQIEANNELITNFNHHWSNKAARTATAANIIIATMDECETKSSRS